MATATSAKKGAKNKDAKTTSPKGDKVVKQTPAPDVKETPAPEVKTDAKTDTPAPDVKETPAPEVKVETPAPDAESKKAAKGEAAAMKEFIEPYRRAYPNNKKFFITSDKQVFLEAHEQFAKDHQKTLEAGSKYSTYEV
jgi:DsbC/DsbD-like thiol-disulfide interchange protein